MARHLSARTSRAGRQLGEHLATWRKLLNLTSEQLADRAGTSRVTLSKLENGDVGVSVGVVLDVLRALGQLDNALRAIDPYESDLGRFRAGEKLPQRVKR